MSDALTSMYKADEDVVVKDKGEITQIHCEVDIFVSRAKGGKSSKKARDLLLSKVGALAQKYNGEFSILGYLDDLWILVSGAYDFYYKRRYKR